jgi:hypothetical protein
MLCRAGQLKEALRFNESMPTDPYFVTRRALFCACRARKKTNMAESASEELLELEQLHKSSNWSYVFLSNAYAAVG